MLFKKERVFDYPFGKFLDVFVECENPPYDIHELENVTKWKVVRETDDGARKTGTKEWCAHAQIPPALRHIISPKMLTWYEHSEWNRKTNIYSFRIEPFFFKNKVTCYGKTAYEEKGNGKTLRIFEVTLKVKFPVVGPLFEATVMSLLRKNEEQDFGLCLNVIKKARSAGERV